MVSLGAGGEELLLHLALALAECFREVEKRECADQQAHDGHEGVRRHVTHDCQSLTRVASCP